TGFYDDDDGLPYGPMPPRRPRKKPFLSEEGGDDEEPLTNGGGGQSAKSGAAAFFEGVTVPSGTFIPSPLQASDTTLDEAITGRINESLRAVSDDAQVSRASEHEAVESRFNDASDTANSKHPQSTADVKPDTVIGQSAGPNSVARMDLAATNLSAATSGLGRAIQDIHGTKLSQAKAPASPAENWQNGTVELKGRNQVGIFNVAALIGNTLAQIQAERADIRRPIDGPVGIREGKTALLDAAGIRAVPGTSAIEGPLSTLAWIAPLSRANELGLSGGQLQTALNELMKPRSTGTSGEVRADLIKTASNFTDYPETSIRELENMLSRLPHTASFKGQVNLGHTDHLPLPTPTVESAPPIMNPPPEAQPLQSRITRDQPVQTKAHQDTQGEGTGRSSDSLTQT